MKKEIINARGHECVTALHPSTFEITLDDRLTPAGDCILGICADRSPADFDSSFVDASRNRDARITAVFESETLHDTIIGHGHPNLTLKSDRGMVGRTSEYIDDRTILLGANKAARDLDPDLVDKLAQGAKLTVSIVVD